MSNRSFAACQNADEVSHQSPLRAGDRPPPAIPDFELLRVIGRGAYGEVWLARSITGAWRALKIVRREAFEHDRPFEREFEGIQKFEPISRKHASQVDILHVGRGADYFYYVMELADDEITGGQIDPEHYSARTLKSDLFLHGRLSFEDSVRIGIQLATALEHLHANGLAHRDVKPSNIIFVNGMPKLADIGLVAGIDATRSYVGTSGFAAPEGAGSPQADLYSLGKVLYEMATGKDRQEFPELPTALRDFPDRESLRELNAVIAQACRHDPHDRYPSAGALRADLELLQSGKSLARLRRTEARLRLVQRFMAGLCVIALLIGAGWLWQARQTQAIRKLAIEKTLLADHLARVESENRQRLARLSIANGIRTLDEGDSAGALLWFAQALPLLADHPDQESIHRIRIGQALLQTARVLHVTPVEAPLSSWSVSPDGQRIATATTQQVRVTDTATGRLLWERAFPEVDRILQLSFTRDGQRLFGSSVALHGFAHGTLSPTNILTVLDAQSGEPLIYLRQPNLVRADLSPCGRFLVTAETDHQLALHDSRDGRLLACLEGHFGPILVVQFSLDGTILASSSLDGTVRLWHVPSGEPIGAPLCFHTAQGPINLSRDGLLLATAGADPDNNAHALVQTWSVQSGQRIGALAFERGIEGLEFLPPDGERLLVITQKETGLIAHAAANPSLSTLAADIKASCWTVSRDGHWMVLGGTAGLFGAWDSQSGEQSLPAMRGHGPVRDLQWLAGCGRLAICTEDAVVTIDPRPRRGLAEKRLSSTLGSHGPDVRHRLTAERRRLLAPHGDGKFSLIDLDQRTDWEVPPPHRPGARAGWFSIDPRGGQIAIDYSGGEGDRSPFLEVWQLTPQHTNRLVLPYPGGMAGFMEFSSDGSRLMAACGDRKVWIWDTATGQLDRTIPLPEGLDAGDLRPDQFDVFGAWKRGQFALFNLTNQALVTVSLPFSGTLSKRIFDPSNTRLATVVEGHSWTHVFSLESGLPLTPLLDHGNELNWVNFSPDGRSLLTAGVSPEIRIWNSASGERFSASLISQRRINPAGGISRAEPSHLLELCQSLRQRAPELFE